MKIVDVHWLLKEEPTLVPPVRHKMDPANNPRRKL